MRLILIFVCSVAALGRAFAESPVPIENEPRHHLKFQNGSVRLFDVLIPPGDTTLFHIHVNDGVGIKLADCQIREEVTGREPADSSAKRGDVGFTRYPSGFTHRVSNIGSTPFRNILVEILPSRGTPLEAPSLASVAGHNVVLSNDRVEVSRLALAPGESTGNQTHLLRGVTVAVTGATIAVELADQPSGIVKFKPGDFKWHERGMEPPMRNVGVGAVELITIDLK